jgi:hypothetical protein
MIVPPLVQMDLYARCSLWSHGELVDLSIGVLPLKEVPSGHEMREHRFVESALPVNVRRLIHEGVLRVRMAFQVNVSTRHNLCLHLSIIRLAVRRLISGSSYFCGGVTGGGGVSQPGQGAPIP